jgi:16S rRNA (adenine1518-N6/adenine1519-N6)-dimethyltransferase
MRPPPIRKSLGQHFLTDPRILARIADAVALAPDETVVEIGPGRGSLTDALLARAARVVAIEIDRKLVELLREKYAHEPRLTIIEADVLDVNLGEAAGGEYALAGNVPYYITTPILFQALKPPRAVRSVLLVQREVAARMSAEPGAEDYGALSVNVQAIARVEMLFRIPAGAFTPPPRVDSAVVRVTPRADPVVVPGEEEPFRTFVQAAFALRRKQMRRVVRTIAPRSAEDAERALEASGVDPDARPETLSAAQFHALGRALELWS